MTYELTPVQKRLLSEAGHHLLITHWKGDANDFSCVLADIAMDHWQQGRSSDAWSCYQNDPMATYGATYDAWEEQMKTKAKTRSQNEAAMKAHSEAMYRVD